MDGEQEREFESDEENRVDALLYLILKNGAPQKLEFVSSEREEEMSSENELDTPWQFLGPFVTVKEFDSFEQNKTRGERDLSNGKFDDHQMIFSIYEWGSQNCMIPHMVFHLGTIRSFISQKINTN